MTDRRLEMHEALVALQPGVRAILQGMIERASLQRKVGDRPYEPVPGTIEPDLLPTIAGILQELRRIEALIGRAEPGPAWLDEIIDGTRSL